MIPHHLPSIVLTPSSAFLLLLALFHFAYHVVVYGRFLGRQPAYVSYPLIVANAIHQTRSFAVIAKVARSAAVYRKGTTKRK